MWGEKADARSLNAKLWPHAAAVAEQLWAGHSDDTENALSRLLRHRCRMVQRGVAVTALQPGFC